MFKKYDIIYANQIYKNSPNVLWLVVKLYYQKNTEISVFYLSWIFVVSYEVK